MSCKSLKTHAFHIDNHEFNIIHIIRFCFSHAVFACLGAAAFLPPLRFAAAPRKCNDPNTHPRLKIFGEPT